MKTEEEIKMRLSSLLSAEEVDYGEILSLSNELSKYDKDNVRFSVDAGVIDRLGSELVARQETAVSELIKNAYDADATHVKLIFENTASVGGRLYISDNGSGMSRDELINGFMRIASTSKIHNKYSSKFRRSRAGQKGIGRFAVQRLGQKLIIRTQSDESDIALELSIDWKDYQNDTDLFSISNSIKEIPQLPNSGTTLIIDDLSDKWSKASIKRIYRYISEIIQPFSLSDDINHSNNNFTVTLSKMENAISEDIVDSRLNVYDYATAIIDGKISDDGIGHFDIYSEKLDINESGFIGNDPNNDNVPFNKLNNVKFRAYYFTKVSHPNK